MAASNLVELSSALGAGAVSSRDATRACLDRLAGIAPLNCALSVLADSALAEAEASDQRRARGQARGPLDGVPVGVKDNILVRGAECTCGSALLRGWTAPYDATVVARLRHAGAVILAKLNCDEFGMGSSNENSAFGPCRNPWDPTRSPGGSSGGPAAAVSAGACPGALGTDTGGSVRQPAAFCGITGLRPTYGLLSRYGVVAYASSLDQVGPMARGVEDVTLLLQALAGHDGYDSTSADLPIPDYGAALTQDLRGLKLGLPREVAGLPGLSPVVAQAVDRAVRAFEEGGAEVREVSLPHLPYAIACYYLIATAEASANLARYDGVRYGVRVGDDADLSSLYLRTRSSGFGVEVQRRILLGTFALSKGYCEAYYQRAQKVRALIAADLAAAFDQVDLLVTPTAPTPAFGLGEKLAHPLEMYLSDVFTVPVNLGGACALSVPCGFTEGPRPLPLGLQLIAAPFAEATLLRAGAAFQRVTDWHRRAPTPEASGG